MPTNGLQQNCNVSAFGSSYNCSTVGAELHGWPWIFAVVFSHRLLKNHRNLK
jgi:hypothetical protein